MIFLAIDMFNTLPFLFERVDDTHTLVKIHRRLSALNTACHILNLLTSTCEFTSRLSQLLLTLNEPKILNSHCWGLKLQPLSTVTDAQLWLLGHLYMLCHTWLWNVQLYVKPNVFNVFTHCLQLYTCTDLDCLMMLLSHGGRIVSALSITPQRKQDLFVLGSTQPLKNG